MAVSKLNPAAAGIPYGDNAGRPANATTGQPYFNGEAGRLELYTTTGWNNIVQETPGISSAIGHYYQSDGYGVFTISGTNFVDGAIAYAVGINGTEYEATSTTYNSLVQLNVTFNGLSANYEPYDLKVVNPSNLFGLLPDAFYVNDSPVWSTSIGSLGSVYGGSSVSKTVGATDDESDALTYSISSGSLPSGLSLNSATGVISGTAPLVESDTTYTFTVSASDSYNTAVTRQFSIPVIAVSSVTGGTLTSDSTYYYRTFTSNGSLNIVGKALPADILMVAGGGGGGYQVGGGGGGGGYVQLLNYNVTSGSNSIVIGSGGSGGSGSSRAYNGGNTTISLTATTLTAVGGGGGSNHTVNYNQNNNQGWDGGSGGGGSGDSNSTSEYGGASTQPTTVGGQSGVGFGTSGGRGRTGDWAGGGGGGAGQAGYDSPSGGNGGNGGSGKQWLNGSYYSGGGGGCNNSSSSNVSGGNGGGGSGTGNSNNSSAKNGTSNTGGGGGGVRDTSGDGGNGGSGIVIIRYTRSAVGE